MAWFDFLRRRRDPRREVAEQIALEVGVLERCPVCREVVDKRRDTLLADADRRAEQLIADRDPSVAAFNGDLPRLQQLLREVRKPYPFSCRCEAYD